VVNNKRMQHSRLTRIIAFDGLGYVGGYDKVNSDEWRVYFLGHTRFFYRRQIVDMFERKDNKWHRVTGSPYVYDAYLEAGGDAWPAEFERFWSAEKPELFLNHKELYALHYTKSKH